MIQATNIYKKYGAVEVLKGVSLEIKQGEIISIVGASGAGKTTLLQILGTLEKKDAGNLLFDQLNPEKLNDKNLSDFRNKNLGFIFQFHQLLPEFTALENVCLPGFIAKRDKKELEENAKELMDLLGVYHRASHKPMELSGGEQQRVAAARALINKPMLILGDEPSGNLDSKNATELHELFFKLREKYNQSFVIVTHNNQLADMADRKLTMKDGVIV